MSPDREVGAVVVVDDEPDHALIVRRLLAELAPDLLVEIAVLADPARLEDRAAQLPERALVLVDRWLGGREAFDAVELVCRARPDVRVAVLSAWLDEPDRRRAVEAGACAAAQKPGSLDGWRELLRGLLATARAPAGLRGG